MCNFFSNMFVKSTTGKNEQTFSLQLTDSMFHSSPITVPYKFQQVPFGCHLKPMMAIDSCYCQSLQMTIYTEFWTPPKNYEGGAPIYLKLIFLKLDHNSKQLGNYQ